MSGLSALLWSRIVKEIPEAKMKHHHESAFLRFLFKALGWITKKITSRKTAPNWSHYVVTIGKTIYVPKSFFRMPDHIRYSVLRHELVHMRQFRRWPFPCLDIWGLRTINFVLVAFCYLLVFPAFWTLRAKFEREAYLQNFLVLYEMKKPLCVNDFDWMISTFAGPTYFWMWRKKAAKAWIKDSINKVMSRHYKNDKDNVLLEENG